MPGNIYRASSFSQFIFTVIVRMGLIPLVIYLYSHFNENSNVIMAAIAICVLTFLFVSYEVILVDADKVTQKDISLGNWLLRSKGRQYLMSEIKHAAIPSPERSSRSEIGVAVILRLLLPEPRSNRGNNRCYPISLQFKDGRNVLVLTSVSESKRREIVEAINSSIR